MSLPSVVSASLYVTPSLCFLLQCSSSDVGILNTLIQPTSSRVVNVYRVLFKYWDTMYFSNCWWCYIIFSKLWDTMYLLLYFFFILKFETIWFFLSLVIVLSYFSNNETPCIFDRYNIFEIWISNIVLQISTHKS